MKKMLYKLLSLCLCMCLSAPVMVFAGAAQEKEERAAADYRTVNVTLRYLDNARPDETLRFEGIKNGMIMEQKLDILDGYDLVNMGVRAYPSFDMDMDTKLLTIGPIEQDYNILLEFEKTPVTEHTVSITTHYMDGAIDDDTREYKVAPGTSFSETFFVEEGYELYNYAIRSMPFFNVDMDKRVVSIDAVDQDYHITLDFDKAEYKMQLHTNFKDDPTLNKTYVSWVRDGEDYMQKFEVPEGYRLIVPLLPDIYVLREDEQIFGLLSVHDDLEYTLEFERLSYDVTVRVVDDNTGKDMQYDVFQVYHGDDLQVPFTIERGYSIRKMTMNAPGIMVDRANGLVTFGNVRGPSEVVIYVR